VFGPPHHGAAPVSRVRRGGRLRVGVGVGQDAGVRPFRFLGLAAPGIVDAREIVGTARRAESIGYSTLVLPDHLLEQFAPGRSW
jgi:hypothetical protein